MSCLSMIIIWIRLLLGPVKLNLDIGVVLRKLVSFISPNFWFELQSLSQWGSSFCSFYNVNPWFLTIFRRNSKELPVGLETNIRKLVLINNKSRSTQKFIHTHLIWFSHFWYITQHKKNLFLNKICVWKIFHTSLVKKIYC